MSVFGVILVRIFPAYSRIWTDKKGPCWELFWFAFFPHFPTSGLNTERYSVSVFSPNAGKCRKNAGRITPNKDTLYVVCATHEC